MNLTSESVRPESEARDRRVSALAAGLRPLLPPGFCEGETMEVCNAFDQAVEFSACEGKPVSAAIAGFLTEGWGPAQVALKTLVVPAVPFFPEKLPVLPRAASQLLQTCDDKTSVSELEQIAGSDPALAAQLLGAANSALFGSRSEIYRLRDAVMRLGIPVARTVLLTASFSRLFATQAMQNLWQHSQHVAGVAFQLAGLCAADPASAYAAGLLHDIGRVAFTVFPASMRAAERRWLDAGFPLIYAETMAYGSDHAGFGAELLHSWRLPVGILEAVAHHHRPECSDSPLHAVVHLAESSEEDLWSNMRKKVALDRTGITEAQLAAILCETNQQGIGNQACA